MGQQATQLRMYGRPSEQPQLEWSWAEARLAAAGTYWVVASAGPAHPRPVWGVWSDQALHLSIGSPVLTRQLAEDPRVSVHLESGTEVVIVSGIAGRGTDPDALAVYRTKYDSSYDVAEFGDLTPVRPVSVIAWQAAGWAGRDGFRATGKWVLPH